LTIVGLDRLSNWAGLAAQEGKDRPERWLDVFQAALDRDYPSGARSPMSLYEMRSSLFNELRLIESRP